MFDAQRIQGKDMNCIPIIMIFLTYKMPWINVDKPARKTPEHHANTLSSDATQVWEGLNNSGFMLILQSLATQPLNCRSDCTPSKMRICVNPISLMNSSFECSDSVGIVLVTRNIVLIISWDEYPRVLESGESPCTSHHKEERWHTITHSTSPKPRPPYLPSRPWS